jgi:hypothetical protein
MCIYHEYVLHKTEILCAGSVKLFAEAPRPSRTLCPQNGVLGVHPSQGQKHGSRRVLNDPQWINATVYIATLSNTSLQSFYYQYLNLMFY